MYNFFANPRDGFARGGACNTCCCEVIHGKPGETNSIEIDYAMWGIPIAERGLTINTWFDVVPISPGQVDTGNQQPLLGALIWNTTTLDPIVGDLKTYVIDPEGDAMTFTYNPIFGPKNGTLQLLGDGTFTYTPNPGSNRGIDYFYFTATDSAGNTVTGEAALGVFLNLNQVSHLPIVRANNAKKKINSERYTLRFPLEISAAARTGDVYRLNVRQEAMDCDGNLYYHVSCFDIIIGKC